jgi:hypothetical protein
MWNSNFENISNRNQSYRSIMGSSSTFPLLEDFLLVPPWLSLVDDTRGTMDGPGAKTVTFEVSGT